MRPSRPSSPIHVPLRAGGAILSHEAEPQESSLRPPPKLTPFIPYSRKREKSAATALEVVGATSENSGRKNIRGALESWQPTLARMQVQKGNGERPEESTLQANRLYREKPCSPTRAPGQSPFRIDRERPPWRKEANRIADATLAPFGCKRLQIIGIEGYFGFQRGTPLTLCILRPTIRPPRRKPGGRWNIDRKEGNKAKGGL